MPNLSIKQVPEHIAEQLRQRAALNHRSLQGELMAILTQAVESAAPQLLFPAQQSALTYIGPGILAGSKSSEQVAAEVRQRWPRPIDTGPLAVDILRKERDAR